MTTLALLGTIFSSLICQTLPLPFCAEKSPQASRVYPSAAQVQRAQSLPFEGKVGWAIIDSKGKLHGELYKERFRSASLSKAMLLVARLSREPSPTLSERASVLHPMIHISDNKAADVVFYQLGSSALTELAQKTGMKDFSAEGYWANSFLSARDQALFFYKLPRLLPDTERIYALNELEKFASYQSWAIAKVGKERGWQVYHKAGWRPEGSSYRFNQAARLCRKAAGCFAIAVLTEAQEGPERAHYQAEKLARALIPDCKRYNCNLEN